MGKLEENNHLRLLGIDGRILLNGSARNGSSLDWDDLSLDGELLSGSCENQSESLGCVKCVELLD